MTQVSTQLCEQKQKISILEKSLSDLESNTENKVNELQVIPFNKVCFSVLCWDGLSLQSQITNQKSEYEALASMISEMDIQASSARQLEHDKEMMQKQIRELQTQIGSKRKRMDELVVKEETIHKIERIFNNPSDSVPMDFPVIQQNGLVVDLYKVLTNWAKYCTEEVCRLLILKFLFEFSQESRSTGRASYQNLPMSHHKGADFSRASQYHF